MREGVKRMRAVPSHAAMEPGLGRQEGSCGPWDLKREELTAWRRRIRQYHTGPMFQGMQPASLQLAGFCALDLEEGACGLFSASGYPAWDWGERGGLALRHERPHLHGTRGGHVC